LPNCQYTYEPDFACDRRSITNSKFCFFHDKDHYAEHEHEAIETFEEKVSNSISQNKPLEYFGYYLPAIGFGQLLKKGTFWTIFKKGNFCTTSLL
jgi:hypothetical protein